MALNINLLNISFWLAGKHAIIEGLKILEKVKWGIAGRKQENLDEVLKLVGEKAEKDLSKIATIVADANDAESLIKMAQRAKVCFYFEKKKTKIIIKLEIFSVA